MAGKRILVILADVWDENLNASFDPFFTPLKCAALGSTIIMTTRNEDIARMLRPTSIVHLNELPDADCWSLFIMRVFGDPHAAVDKNLEAILRQIVARCRGLPLAIKALGDLTLKIKPASSNIWDSCLPNGILPALLLSHQHLPPHLRRCFAYCSIFPTSISTKTNLAEVS